MYSKHDGWAIIQQERVLQCSRTRGVRDMRGKLGECIVSRKTGGALAC